MSREPVADAQYELAGTPELRCRLYGAIARELAATPYPAAVLFETSTAREAVDLTLAPAAVFGSVLAAPAFGSVRPRTTLRARLAPPPDPAATFVWVLSPRQQPAAPAPGGVWDVPDRSALLGAGGLLESQTFWAGGRNDGRIWAARRVRFRASDSLDLARRAVAVGAFGAAEWSRATGVLCEPVPVRSTVDAWERAASRTVPRPGWLALPASVAERSAEPLRLEVPEPLPGTDGHTVVLGSSGAGKTTYLAETAVRALRAGGAVLTVDLHGDLGPAVVARLGSSERERVVAVDVEARPVVGIAALRGSDERAAAHFVASVKRLSPDGAEIYWGFRLERIFDAAVRLVQETGGSLDDLYALLTDADRRDEARLTTRRPELARFLRELEPVVRRTPDFLWGAASRLGKVVLVPELRELLSPPGESLPIEELLEAPGAVVVRVPFATVGPEAASFAASMVVGRAYLGLAARRRPGGVHRPVTFVLDEVQGLSPRLVAEMLSEGRKFGVRVAIATQYPERLAPELRSAAAGVGRGVIVFRVPRAAAAGIGGWVGLTPGDAERVLSDLPVGVGLARAPGSGELRPVTTVRPPPTCAEPAWAETVERTRDRFAPAAATSSEEDDAATERLLLAVLAAEERGTPLTPERLLHAAEALPGAPVDAAELEGRLARLSRAGLLAPAGGALRLTAAGERRLGLRTTTGATRESSEHRALLLRTFRIFARHGCRLEIVRQGRFDTTLPDGRFRQLGDDARARPPREVASALAEAQRSWAWRCFHGLDVHVEAEVSGALRVARIRHGWEKARRREAYALFVVGDAHRAAKVRAALHALGAGRETAQVWTLGVRPEVSGSGD